MMSMLPPPPVPASAALVNTSLLRPSVVRPLQQQSCNRAPLTRARAAAAQQENLIAAECEKRCRVTRQSATGGRRSAVARSRQGSAGSSTGSSTSYSSEDENTNPAGAGVSVITPGYYAPAAVLSKDSRVVLPMVTPGGAAPVEEQHSHLRR